MALFPRAKRDIFAEVRTARPRPKIFAELQKHRARRGRVEGFRAVPQTNAGECAGTPFGYLPPPAPGGAGKDGVDAERGPPKAAHRTWRRRLCTYVHYVCPPDRARNAGLAGLEGSVPGASRVQCAASC